MTPLPLKSFRAAMFTLILMAIINSVILYVAAYYAIDIMHSLGYFKEMKQASFAIFVVSFNLGYNVPKQFKIVPFNDAKKTNPTV